MKLIAKVAFLLFFNVILIFNITFVNVNSLLKPLDWNSYIKNSIVPDSLYVISLDNLTPEERIMISTLQGIISNKSNSQIYTLISDEPDYEIWLKDLEYNYSIKTIIVDDPWRLLDIFKSYIKGYVIYNNIPSNNPSINNACTLASLKDSIVITPFLETLVNKHGITKLIKDCRNTDKYWAFNNLWNEGLNHSTVIELPPNKDANLRDYAIMSKSLIFYEDSISDTSLRDMIFKSMDHNSICLGWGPDEFTNVNLTSKYGIDMIAADWSYNLSTLSSFPLNHKKQKKPSNLLDENNIHYVTFIMSDGDNQQWYLGNNLGNNKWYGSPIRGEFNLGWGISPSIYYLAPTVFDSYYKKASSGRYYDNFVVPPSGNGYIYPSKFPVNKLDNYTEKLNNYMKNVDINNVVVLDDSSFYNTEIWDKYTKRSNIAGLFYLDYHRHDNYHGEIIWSNNKPIVSCRDILWKGLEEEEVLINNINSRITSGYTNVKNPNAYSFVYVHVWSKDMSNLLNVINKLNKNPQVRIVTPDNFIELINKNLRPL